MKRKLLMSTLIAAVFGLPHTAMASGEDCFPMCPERAKVEAKLDPVYVEAHRGIEKEPSAPSSCESRLLKTADEINDKVKPIREVIGYVRSPQGLVFKLVNDHVVRIPAWIGYMMDPLGSLRHKAIDEVRGRAREAMVDQTTCGTASADVPQDANEAADAKHSI
jgi:hypothetical protein